MMALYVLQRYVRLGSLDRAVLMGGHLVKILTSLLQQAEAEVRAPTGKRAVLSNRVPDRAINVSRPVSIRTEMVHSITDIVSETMYLNIKGNMRIRDLSSAL